MAVTEPEYRPFQVDYLLVDAPKYFRTLAGNAGGLVKFADIASKALQSIWRVSSPRKFGGSAVSLVVIALDDNSFDCILRALTNALRLF
jgi:hypothetical protein